MFPRIFSLGMIKRKAADELGLEGVGQLASLFDFVVEVFLKRHKAVLRAIFLIEQLDLADWRAERRDVEAVFILQMADAGDLRLAELHYVFDTLAGINKPQ